MPAHLEGGRANGRRGADGLPCGRADGLAHCDSGVSVKDAASVGGRRITPRKRREAVVGPPLARAAGGLPNYVPLTVHLVGEHGSSVPSTKPFRAASILDWMSGVTIDALSWIGREADRRRRRRRVVEHGPGLEVAGGLAEDRRLDGVLQLLLGAGDQARGDGRDGQGLVDVDADAVDLRGAGGLEGALAGQPGDLEDDVRALLDLLLGDRLALGRVVEALGRIRVGLLVEDLDVRLDRLGAVLVAAPVVDDGRDVRATDGADRAGLGQAGRDDAGEVARLGLGEDDALVVREQRRGVALAGERRIRVRRSRRRRRPGRRR